MSKETVISKQELDILKSNGTVYLCRSCKDFKDKLVLLEYKPNKIHGIFEGFCKECKSSMQSCGACNLRR